MEGAFSNTQVIVVVGYYMNIVRCGDNIAILTVNEEEIQYVLPSLLILFLSLVKVYKNYRM